MKRPGRAPSSLAGHLLLAHPSLKDDNFRRSVVLLSAHDGDGALGVVLNRPTGRTLGELSEELALTTLAGLPVYHGGPVETEKLILVAWQLRAEPSEFQLSFGLNPDRAAALVATPGVCVRGFLGYAGWSAGQLENELTHHTWFTAPAAAYNLAAAEGTGLWRLFLGSLDPELKLLADEPEDPALN